MLIANAQMSEKMLQTVRSYRVSRLKSVLGNNFDNKEYMYVKMMDRLFYAYSALFFKLVDKV